MIVVVGSEDDNESVVEKTLCGDPERGYEEMVVAAGEEKGEDE